MSTSHLCIGDFVCQYAGPILNKARFELPTTESQYIFVFIKHRTFYSDIWGPVSLFQALKFRSKGTINLKLDIDCKNAISL